ncbi:MAG: hypothetical protein ACREMI_11700 [Gemmatimonadales bacterium]
MGSCKDGSSPGGSARIDFIAGAIEPVLTRGERFVVEGLGFGDTAGTVLFTRVGGGTIEAAVADSDWTPFAITVVVPDSAATGREALSVQPAGGSALIATVHILARVPFAPASLTWAARTGFPGAPAGIALTAAQFPEAGGVLNTTLYAAGGAEPPQMIPDSGVYVAHVTPGGAGTIDVWARQRDTSDQTRSRVLPAPRAFAATVVATRFNSRFRGSALYVIGGVDTAGRAQATVFGADITPDSVTGRFVTLEPLPAPRAGALAVLRHGRIYIIGGTDALGRPQTSVYMGRIGVDGHIDGWYVQPPLTGPRAYGGGIARGGRVVAIGGVADSVPAGGGLAPGTQRLVTGDTAAVSPLTGFFTGAWGTGPAVLPEGRSQFVLFDLDSTVLAVGGVYAGAATNSAETVAASVSGDSLGPFTGPVGTNRIADLVCVSEPAGTLVGAAGITWREANGTPRGVLVGGLDLATGARRTCSWGF